MPAHAAVANARVPHVVATPAARAAIARLRAQRGPLMFDLAGGARNGGNPVCLPQGELALSDQDALLGWVGSCPFYVERQQLEPLRQAQLLLDVGDGETDGFSLPPEAGKRFCVRSRPLAPHERATLNGLDPGEAGA